MHTKAFHVSSKSGFGRRVITNEEEKLAVAIKTVYQVLWPTGETPMNSVFLSDGTSPSFVWYWYLERWLKEAQQQELTVYTNNVDVPLQVMHRSGTVKGITIENAPGRFSFKDCANFGTDTQKWVRNVCENSMCILGADSLDAELGPCSHDERSRSIKAAVLESARMLIVVLDHTKLQRPRNFARAANRKAWVRWRDKRSADGRLFVITGVSAAGSTASREEFTVYPDKRTSKESIESDNIYLLQSYIGHSFITIPESDVIPTIRHFSSLSTL